MHSSEFRLHLNCALDSPRLFTHTVQNTLFAFIILFFILICKYINLFIHSFIHILMHYIYVYTYIYIHICIYILIYLFIYFKMTTNKSHKCFCTYLPGPLQTTLEPTNLLPGVNKYARCGYTNFTCPQLGKTAPTHRIAFFQSFPFFHFKNQYLQTVGIKTTLYRMLNFMVLFLF